MAAESTTEMRKQMLRALTRHSEAIEALIASGSLDIAAESLSTLEQGNARYLAALRACVTPATPSAKPAPVPAAAPTPSQPVPVPSAAAPAGAQPPESDDPFAGRI